MIRNIYILLLLSLSYSETLLVPDEYSTSVATVEFIFPLRATNNFDGHNFYTTNDFVDHDSSPIQVLDYNCGDRTFNVPNDENEDHAGTDYYLAPFPWRMMENESVEIVAAADGVILVKKDGNSDQNCGGNPEDSSNWNGVVIWHSDFSILYYIHMKAGSVTDKNQGEFVSQGEYLGLPGSSGFSHIPHLHFAYYEYWTGETGGGVIDPYSGECDSSSYWINQKPYYDSAILQVMTHSSPPIQQECPDKTIINEKNVFTPGEEIYIGVYFRDHIN